MKSETALHAQLKDLYTLPGAAQEVLVDNYWIDVVHEGRLIEIQTGSFSKLKVKLSDLLPRYPVRVVHPVALEKWIVNLPATGDAPVSRRRSPRRGRYEDLFAHLVHLPRLIREPNFSLEVLLVRSEEIRRADGRGSWRRGGVSIIDQRLLEVVDRRLFQTPEDLGGLMPDAVQEPFTNLELAKSLKIRPRLAARMTYCLCAAGVLEKTDKRNRSYLFQRTKQP
jgi:hypothetical protein